MANIIVTINRPELTPKEREKRMDAIKQAAVKLVLETEKAKKRNAQTKNQKRKEEMK